MTYDIPSHRRGDTWDGINSITINVNGVPINLTNATVKMEFRQDLDAPVALTLTTTNSSIMVTNAVGGIISIPSKKIEVPFAKYFYDLQVTYSTGIVKTYMSGTWEIIADITE
jgi:hypothetical protein